MKICKKCGEQITANMKFCINCGAGINTELSEDVRVTENIQDMPKEPVEEVLKEEIKEMPALETTTTETKPKKRWFKRKLFIIPLVILLVLSVAAGVVWSFRYKILFETKPETYSALVINNTLSEIGKELKKSQKNLFGFDLSGDEYTLSVSGGADNLSQITPDTESIGGNIAVGLNKTEGYMAVEGNLEVDKKEYSVLSGYWDDENFAAKSQELVDSGVYMPAKDFGKAWNDSEIGREISDKTDISFTNIMEAFSKDREFVKNIKKSTFELINGGKVSDKSEETMEIDGKNRKIQKWDLTLDSENVKDYVVEIFDMISIDEPEDNPLGMYINFMLRRQGLDEEDIEKTLENVKEQLENFKWKDITVTFYAYKSRIAKLEYVHDWEKDDIHTYILSFEGEKLINNIKLQYINEYEYRLENGGKINESTELVFTLQGDIVGKKGEIYGKFKGERINKGDDYFERYAPIVMDFEFSNKKNAFEIYAEYDEGGFMAEGKYSLKDKFNITVENVRWNGYNYRSRYDEAYDTWDYYKEFERNIWNRYYDLELNIALEDKCHVEKPDVKEDINVFEFAEDEELYHELLEEGHENWKKIFNSESEEAVEMPTEAWEEDWYYEEETDWYYEEDYYEESTEWYYEPVTE